jgi:hypothetical protein
MCGKEYDMAVQTSQNVTLEDIWAVLMRIDNEIQELRERVTGVEAASVEKAEKAIDREAFRLVLQRTHGAWKDNPWTNHLEDVRAMREEWDDPWNPAAQESCRKVMMDARAAAGKPFHE